MHICHTYTYMLMCHICVHVCNIYMCITVIYLCLYLSYICMCSYLSYIYVYIYHIFMCISAIHIHMKTNLPLNLFFLCSFQSHLSLSLVFSQCNPAKVLGALAQLPHNRQRDYLLLGCPPTSLLGVGYKNNTGN